MVLWPQNHKTKIPQHLSFMFGEEIKKQFPIFQHHPKLVYLDNAATTHKPKRVIDAIQHFYERENANIHRGIYDLASQTSIKYEKVRAQVAQFLGADEDYAIVYTSGTTASINLVASSFLLSRLEEGDEVVISEMEHHANLIPWQMVCRTKGATLKTIPVSAEGELDVQAYQKLLSAKTKLVAITHISNSLGTINPIEEMIATAHQEGVPVLVDGAQSAAHYPIQLKKWDCDFFTFSGHKIFGPTGIGVLCGKKEWLEQMQPYQFGGDMIKKVNFETTTFANIPQRFEAGTTNIAGVIGLGSAIEFLEQFDKKEIAKYVKHLGRYAQAHLMEIDGVEIVGKADQKTGICSFLVKNAHPHDVATFLGSEQIAVRAGHHCTQPLMEILGIPGTSRASFTIYNTEEDVNQLVRALVHVISFFNV